jgi:hypothetical protein
MKKLSIPDPKFDYVDADWIQKTLHSRNGINKRRGDKLTLYGAYKHVRVMPTFGSLGDYVILSQVVDFFKSEKIHFTETEVKRCFRYFEDYNPKRWRGGKSMLVSLMG